MTTTALATTYGSQLITIAGYGSSNNNWNGGDGTLATGVMLNGFWKIATDPLGNTYLAESGDYRLRMIPSISGYYFGQNMTAWYIYTIAGNSDGVCIGCSLPIARQL